MQFDGCRASVRDPDSPGHSHDQHQEIDQSETGYPLREKGKDSEQLDDSLPSHGLGETEAFVIKTLC